jgi:endonuclease-3
MLRKTRSSSSGKGDGAAASGEKPKPPPSLPPPRKRTAPPPPTPAAKKPTKQQQNQSPSTTPADPFPAWPRPTPAECRAVRNALAELHGEPQLGPQTGGDGCSAVAGGSVLGALVRTILSQNTTDATSARAYAALRSEFAESDGNNDTANNDDDKERALWERVRTTPPGRLEAAIRVGGLADIKAARIRAILDTLVAEEEQAQQAAAGGGATKTKGPSLERLRSLSDDEAKSQLVRFNGVGPKSAACVLMFALDRAEFAVDTHVLHLAQRPPLRWVPAAATREQAYQHLNARVPAECKVALHVLLVEHGKRCPACAKGGRLATMKSGAEGGWLGTQKGRAAAEGLASGEVRCPLARAVAAAAAEVAKGVEVADVVKKEEEEAVAVVKKEEAVAAVKKEEEEADA